MLKEDQDLLEKPSPTTSSSLVFSSVLNAAESRNSPNSSNAGNPLEGQALGLLSQLMRSGQPGSLPNSAVSAASALPPIQPNSFAGIDSNQLFLDLVHSSNVGQSNAGSDKKDDNSKQPAKGPKSIIKSGRKSDPRMDAAVEAKINDPDLSLVDALRQGGFVFPNIDDTNAPQYTVVDSDNVKITQRKNQLLRRLRSMKKKG